MTAALDLFDEDVTLLPDCASPRMDAQSATSARLLARDHDAIRRQRRPDACEPAWVPLLAWERSVHFWREGDEAGNRARTASSFEDHLSYGSPEALEAEIAQDVGHAVTLREFDEVPGAEWPDFFVDLDLDQAHPDTWPVRADVLTSAIRRKNVRDMPIVRMFVPSRGPSFLGAAGAIGGVIRSTPLDTAPRSSAGSWLAAFGTVSGIIVSRPVTA